MKKFDKKKLAAILAAVATALAFAQQCVDSLPEGAPVFAPAAGSDLDAGAK